MLLLSNIWSKIKSYLVIILSAMIGALYVALKIVAGQKRAAQERAEQAEHRADTAEARVNQRQKAEAADKQARAEGEKHVEDAINRARSGKRDHFQ